MNEELFQLIWANGLFDMDQLVTTSGLPITIINRGYLNHDAGPDFLNARIAIDHTTWFGQVELHLNASHWQQHKHHLDKAYNSCILHVVLEDGPDCLREDGTVIPCLCLKNRIRAGVSEQYDYLKFSSAQIPCHKALPFVGHVHIRQAIDKALVTRLERKSQWVYDWLQSSSGDWHTVFLAALTRSFGFGTNGDAFEMLALHLPMLEICKSENNLHKITAILLGVAGFLDEAPKDVMHAKLRQEWTFQQQRLNLHSLDKSLFKFMRMRPGNFPSIRLAQLAALLQNFQQLLHGLMNAHSIPAMLNLMDAELPDYWQSHYQLGKEGKQHQARLSLNARQTLLINALVPFLFVYGKQTADENYCVKALDILQKLPPEDNRIIRDWQQLGIEATSAFDSQALIELRKNHCSKRLCSQCPVGIAVLSNYK
jgi:hypothetical protein